MVPLYRAEFSPSLGHEPTFNANAFGGRYSSFRLNVQLADHLAEIVEFLSEKSSEFRAANARRVKRQVNELRLYIGRVQGRVKPIDEPSKRFLRRMRWRSDPLPNVRVDIFVPRFTQSWRIWHTMGSLRRCNRKGPQPARPQMFGHA